VEEGKNVGGEEKRGRRRKKEQQPKGQGADLKALAVLERAYVPIQEVRSKGTADFVAVIPATDKAERWIKERK